MAESKLGEKIAEKIQLLNKRVQDRKTQEIFEDEKMTYDDIADILEISDIQEQRAVDSAPKEIIISILATMKSIAHTIQSKARWEKFVNDHQEKGEDVFTLSSKGDFSNIGQVKEKLSIPCPPRHIVMCTHIKRMSDIKELVEYIRLCNDSWKRPRKLRIYLDEFDKYIDQMRPIIEDIVICEAVAKITIVTATPLKIWANHRGWDKLFVLNPRIQGNANSYLMFKECKHFNTDDIVVDLPSLDMIEIKGPNSKEIIALISHHHKIAIKHPDIYRAGNTIFAPGNISRRSHDAVRQFWNTIFKCAVAIINGERTTKGFYGVLYLETGQAIDIPFMRYKDFTSKEMREYVLSQPDGVLDDRQAQLNEIISDLYCTYNLSKVPFVITGRLCVERAQTLVHPVWGTFTDAIYFNAQSPDDGYQQQRQLGHIKSFPTYRGIPRVFSPEKFRQDVELLEARSDRFATEYANRYATVRDYIEAGGGALTTHEEKQGKANERTAIRSRIIEHNIAFDTISDVNKFLKATLNVKRGINAFEKHGGYEISHRLNPYYKKSCDQLVPEDRLSKSEYDRIPKSYNITSTDKGQKYMVYPVYPTKMSSPSDVKYYICYLPPPSVDVIAHV